jgi:hypothetical protein
MAGKTKGVIVIEGGSIEEVEAVISAAEKAVGKLPKVSLTIYN